MKVLFVASEKWEMKHIPRREGWTFAANGAGARRAAQTVTEDADVVLSVGLCGALDPALRVGDVVVAAAVNGTPLEPPARHRGRTGAIITVDRVVGTAAEKRQLNAATGAAAVEMEAAGVLERAQAMGKRFYCVKAVSDAAGDGFVLDLNAALDSTGHFSVLSILGQAGRRPLAVVPELYRLMRNTRRATRALGDFFEHCSF